LSSFWLILKQQWTIKISYLLFSIFSLVAILAGSRDHRTQFWKRAIQGPFHQSLVAIGPVVMTVITVTVISFTPVIRGIDFVSFYDFSIKFWNFSTGVVVLFFMLLIHYYLEKKR
jgi:hypothetical protein